MVLCSGAFDGLHGGHVAYLEAARALCEGDELLVCAIAPDKYIQISKGRTPHWTQTDRLRTVRALGCVDAAIAQRSDSVAPLIHDYRPRLFIKGPDWEGRLPEEIQRACADVGTSIGYVDTPGVHVSETRASDEEALARFEELVLSQQPAETPWQPVTDYSFEARKEIEGKHAELIRDVLVAAVERPQTPCAGVEVTDTGCGPGTLVHLLRALGVNAAGFDSQRYPSWTAHPVREPNEIVPFNEYRPLFSVHDVTAECLTCCEHGMAWTADVVICREVLEHLTIRQIHRAVVNLCALSSHYVYVTTRFVKQPAHFLGVDTSDDLDPTHITMLAQPFLRMLFVLEGFRRRADLEERLDWQHKGRVLVYERA